MKAQLTLRMKYLAAPGMKYPSILADGGIRN